MGCDKREGVARRIQSRTHISKIQATFPLPHSSQKKVARPYINAIRRKFELSGESDDKFQ